MVKNENNIQIHRPIDEVFAYVSDLQNGPEWQTGLLEVRRTTQGPVGIGTQFTAVRKFLGRKVEANIELIAYEPNRSFTIKSSSGPSPFEQSYNFEPTADGVKVTTLLQLNPGGLMGLAEPLIATSVKREMETAFGDLKDLLESRPVAI